MALFRTDYSGRGELSERQQKLASVCKVRDTDKSFGVNCRIDAFQTEQDL